MRVDSVELSIIGAGRTGRALGHLARRAGYKIGPVVCRTLAHAREAADFIGGGRPGTEPIGSDLTIISVPDGEIRGIVPRLRMPKGAVAAHTCAAFGATELRPLRPAGALHPLRSFADPARAVDHFRGTACAIDGDAPAVRVLSAFARAIGGSPLRVKTDRKALYHAGAVFGSNYLVAILEAATRLFEAAGVPRVQSVGALVGLARGTLANVESVGIASALTGPLERGDVETVRRHADALAARAADLAPAYRVLGRLALEVAVLKGSVSRLQAEKLKAALGPAGLGSRRQPVPPRAGGGRR